MDDWVEVIKALAMLATAVLSGVAAIYAAKARADIKVVEKATNSLMDRLMIKTENEALIRGGIEERGRADARAMDSSFMTGKEEGISQERERVSHEQEHS